MTPQRWSVDVTPENSPSVIGFTPPGGLHRGVSQSDVTQPTTQECGTEAYPFRQSTSHKANELVVGNVRQLNLPKLCEVPVDVEKPEIPVKMFVNRIPKWMTNEQLKTLFSTHGNVLEGTVLKDANQHSKGCAFVKFAHVEDAHKAIQNLHNKIVLNEDAGPVQVKYADGEIERLKLSRNVQPGGDSIKVFVGCLPKTCNEDALYNLFSRYGRVDEVYIIRCKQSKLSKCSAFVTFPKLAVAERAIMELNRQYMLPGSVRPVEVRLADTKLTRSKHGGNSRCNTDDPVNSNATVPDVSSGREICPADTAFEKPLFTTLSDRIARFQVSASDETTAKLESDPKIPTCSHTKRVFGDWWEFVSPSGLLYYYNISTRVSKWELPLDWNQSATGPINSYFRNFPSSQGCAVACGQTNELLPRKSAIERHDYSEYQGTVLAGERFEDNLPEQPGRSTRWLRCVSDSGKLYYYDTLTKRTQWEPPADFQNHSVLLHPDTTEPQDNHRLLATSSNSEHHHPELGAGNSCSPFVSEYAFTPNRLTSRFRFASQDCQQEYVSEETNINKPRISDWRTPQAV